MADWLSQSSAHTAMELSRKTGIGNAYLSQIKNSKWDNDYPSVAVWQKLAYFFGWEYHIDTQNYKNIQGLLGKAMHTKSRAAINGVVSGEGKTYAIRRYCESTPGAYHIICRKSMTSKGLLQTIAKSLKVENVQLNRHGLEEQIADYLKKKGGLLVFDECEYLKGKDAFDSIKTLCDLLEYQAGIVVCGLGLQEMIDVQAKRGKVGMPQLKRRFDWKWLCTEGIQEREIKSFCEASSITDKSAINWFVDKIENYDTLITLVKDALDLADKAKSQITAEFLNEYFQN